MNLQHLQFGKWCYIYPGFGNIWTKLPLTNVYSKQIPFLLSLGLLTTKLFLSPSLCTFQVATEIIKIQACLMRILVNLNVQCWDFCDTLKFLLLLYHGKQVIVTQ